MQATCLAVLNMRCGPAAYSHVHRVMSFHSFAQSMPASPQGTHLQLFCATGVPQTSHSHFACVTKCRTAVFSSPVAAKLREKMLKRTSYTAGFCGRQNMNKRSVEKLQNNSLCKSPAMLPIYFLFYLLA